MYFQFLRRFFLVLALGAILLIAFVLTDKPNVSADGKNALILKAPPFTGVAGAKGAEAATLSFLDNEAGISAYFKSATPITLNDVRSLFRTIETETADYILGSIPVPNYPETEDTHVYIHKDGWVLAYYLKADPVGKIFDWKSYNGVTINTTKLRNVLVAVASGAGSPFPGATYYHFHFPNATKIMLIAEAQLNSRDDSFDINLPGTFAFYERSWSLGCRVGNNTTYYLDDM